MLEKPPIGLRPEWIFEVECLNDRIREICAATNRYLEAGKDVPAEWQRELSMRLASLQKYVQPK